MAERPSIWLVNHYALPPSSSGITRHHDLAIRLEDFGFDVAVVAASFDHYARRDRAPQDIGRYPVEIIDGVRYCWVRTPAYGGAVSGRSRNMVEFGVRVGRGAGRIPLPRPDVVVGSSPHLLTPLGALRLARKLRSAFIMEVRDIWPESLVALGGPSARHPAIVTLAQIERYLYRQSDIVVTLLPGAAEHICHVAKRDVDVRWIPNGAAVPDEMPGPSTNTGPLELMYAGTIGHANNLDVVLDAAELLEHGPDRGKVTWRLVGQGPDRADLERERDRRHLSSVRFEGPVPKSDVPATLASADACLLHLRPSSVFRRGISPNKLFDYFGAARPVLFSVSTPYDYVRDAQAGVSAAPGDPRALADAALMLSAADAATRRQMGINGFRMLEKDFDLDVIAEEYAASFRDLLRRH